MRILSDVGEFGLIARIERLARGQRVPQLVLGIGDDAAVLRPRSGEDLVVSTDSLVEDVHFRWRSQSPATVGRRSLLVNLSDLAAMGARPLGCTVALAAPPQLDLRRFDGLLRGLLAIASEYGCPLVGGNLSKARETSLAITVLGAVKAGRALRRHVVRADDRIFVTGSLGGAALARARAERRGGRLRRLPVPRLRAGRALADLPRPGGCIDISDGFAADLEHLLEGSGLGAEIELQRIPRPRGFAAACASLSLDPDRLCLTGGEDYELLFTLGSDAGCRLSELALSQRLDLPVSDVGRICRRPGVHGLPLKRGWRHY
jgi:thiamine-monophosphate kinase